MKQRFLILFGALLVVTLITQSLANVATSRSSRSIDYGFVAPQECPEPSGRAVLTVAGEKAVAVTGGKKPKVLLKAFNKEKSLTTGSSSYITGDDHAATLASLSPAVAVTACRAAGIDTWFVGGSGALESQSILSLINQAAGPATAELTAWTPSGPTSPTTLTVPALSTVKVSLDRYSSASIALHVRALSGRLGAYVLDTRAKGLTKYGSDYVPPQSTLGKKAVFVGLVGNSSSKIRLLVPGTQDAVVRADVSFGNFRYTPAGLDDVRIKAGTVVELPIPMKDSSGFGALTLTSDVPIAAGVYTPLVNKKKQYDFLWLAPSEPLVAPAMAIYTPQASNSLLLFTEGATLGLSGTDVSKKSKASFSAAPISASPLKGTVRLESNSGAYLALVVKTASGMSVTPVNPIERTQKRLEPVVDLGVLAPR